MATTLVTGPDGKDFALQIDSDCYVDMLEPALDSVSTDYRVVSFWYKYDGVGDEIEYLLEWLDENGTDGVILRSEPDRVYLDVFKGAVTTTASLPSAFVDLRDGSWHFVVVRLDNEGPFDLRIDDIESNATAPDMPLGGGGLSFGISKLEDFSQSGLIYYDFRVYLREIGNGELTLLRNDMLTNQGVNTLPYTA